MMEKIDWNKVRWFKKADFVDDTDLVDSTFMYKVDRARSILDKRMFPSPVHGSFARRYGSKTSRHYAKGRLSDAFDNFCEGIPFENYTKLLNSRLFNGLGIYLDTCGCDGLPWIMFHFDTRPGGFNSKEPLIWIAKKVRTKHKVTTKYYYPQNNPQYWKLLNDRRFYSPKKYGVTI